MSRCSSIQAVFAIKPLRGAGCDTIQWYVSSARIGLRRVRIRNMGSSESRSVSLRALCQYYGSRG